MRSVILKNGTLEAIRRTLNFIQGSNVTLTVADNPTENRVDITIASTGGGGGGGGGLEQYQIRRILRR